MRSRVRSAVVVTIVLLVVFLVLQRTETAMPPVVTIQTAQGKVSVYVELAETDAARRQGLADREKLPATHGMLFSWSGRELQPTFTMAGMRFPLDIIFVNSDGTIASIAENLPACPERRGCQLVQAPKRIASVLEVNAGFSRRHGVTAGNVVILTR